MTRVGTAQNVPFGRGRLVELPHPITAPTYATVRRSGSVLIAFPAVRSGPLSGKWLNRVQAA
jgi:hypothetical protein